MMKHLPTQKSSGYTIIEIIISIFILVIIFSIAQANYRQFILNKNLDAIKSQIISDVKLAQEYALSGKKPATCIGLNGYIFTITPNSNPNLNYYRIMADCATDEEVKRVYLSKIAKGIIFSGSDPNILFKNLGSGTNIPAGTSRQITITQQTSGNTRIITISSGGDVK